MSDQIAVMQDSTSVSSVKTERIFTSNPWKPMRNITVGIAMVIVVLRFGAVAAGQTVSAGIKIHDGFISALTATSGPLVGTLAPPIGSFTTTGTRLSLGPTIEVQVPKGFAISFEAFRHRLSYDNQWIAVSPSTFTRTTFQSNTAGYAWEFPFVLKKYVGAGIQHPIYGEAGLAALHTNASEKFRRTIESTLCPVQACPPTVTTGAGSPEELKHRWTSGVVFGGGVDLRFRRLHFAPELRYTRWLQQSFTTTNNVLHSNSNSVDVVLGMTIDIIRTRPGS
jgi:hypothetical protein